MRVLLALLLVGIAGCGDDPNKKANKLYVESVRLISSAGNKTGDAAIADYEQARANVQKIIDEYGESDLAVKLISGETLFSTIDIRARIEELKDGKGGPDPMDTTRLNIKAFEAAAKMYKIKNKVWPEGATEDVVMLLMMTEDERGNPTAAFLEKIPTDAWGEPLQYKYPADNTGNTFKPLIYSFGPDRDVGGNDNMSNIDDLIYEQGL